MFKEMFNFNKDREENYSEEIVREIIEKLREGKWQDVLGSESFGGNAGENRAAINAWVEKETGRILMFSNIQDLPSELISDPKNTKVSFSYNMGNSFQRIANKDLKVEPDFFEEVLAPHVSRQALANLKKALERFNEEYRASQMPEADK